MTKSKFTKRVALIIAIMLLLSLLTPVIAGCSQTEKPKDPNDGGSEIEYTITFYTDMSGSTASQVEPIKAHAGDPIQQPADPTCPGFVFKGWYTDYGTWENKYDSFTTMPSENLNLYAKWEPISSDAKQEYEDQLNANSKEGCLYIHYMRFNSTPEEYDKYNLWVWPKSMTGMTFDWLRDENNNVIVDPYGGATCEVDLTKVYDKAGNNQDTTTTFLTSAGNYQQGDIFDSEKYTDDSIGFLIVLEESKTGGSHWTSDGGNQFIPKSTDGDAVFADKVRANGSVHIFATQEYVSQYEYSILDVEEVTDPYENDDGTNVSKSNINSSAPSTYPVVRTSGNSTNGDVVEGVGYQIMVSSFADSNGDGMGDIKGITNNLDYLESLNVDVLWLTPIQLSDSYHGYDIIDYKQVDPKFGTLADYQELLAETEKRGMTVIMDLVLNHTSVNNVWFQKSSQLDPAYRSFYQWRNNKDVPSDSTSWHQYSDKEYSYYGKFATSMPELNYDNQATRDAVVDVALYWLKMGVDGLRLDAVKHIYMADEVQAQSTDTIIYSDGGYDSNLTKNLHFFREFNARVKEKYPNAYIVGENFDGGAYNVAPYYEGMDSSLDFYSYYNFAGLFNSPDSAQQLAGINAGSVANKPNGANTGNLFTNTWSYYGTLTTYSKYRGDEQAINTLFTSNHDVARLLNTAAAGNGMTNVTSSNAGLAISRAKVIMATMMSLPGISFIYYGDELGMSGNYENGQTSSSPHVDRQYRQPFKWEKIATDQTTDYSISGDVTYYVEWDSYNSTLDGVKEQKLDDNSMLRYTMKWTELKSNDDVIKYGIYQPLQFSYGGVFAYSLTYQGKTYYCYHNYTGNTYNNCNFPNSIVLADSGVNSSTLPAYASAIFEVS